MLTKNELLDVILAMADIYNRKLTAVGAKLYVSAVYDVVKNIPYDELISKVTRRCEYFPTPKQMMDLFEVNRTALNAAEDFVDSMIAGFTGPEQDWAGLGRDGYHVAKDVIGVTRLDITSGKLKPEFLRKQWIEKAAKHFSNETGQLKIAETKGNSKKELDGIVLDLVKKL